MARRSPPLYHPAGEIVPDQRTGAPGRAADPITPMGELEQFRSFTAGLTRQTRWRRPAARIAAATVLLLIVAFIVAGILATG
jgi:hypothetical protein